MKKGLIFIMIISLINLSACGNEVFSNDVTTESESTDYYVSEDMDAISEPEGNKTELYADTEEAIASGSVSDLVENGCILQMGIDDGDVYSMPVDGETQNTLITINYDEDMQVIIENFDGNKKDFLASSLEDIKKNTFIYVFGEFQENGSINANKIVIFRVVDVTR